MDHRASPEVDPGILPTKGSESARLDAEILMAHALKINRTRLYMEHNKPLDDHELRDIRLLVQRRGTVNPLRILWALKVSGPSN